MVVTRLGFESPGDSHIKRAGMLVWNFRFEPLALRGTNMGVALAYFDPLKVPIKIVRLLLN